MNVNPYNTKEYKHFIPLAGQKNKPNSNPIKPNLVRRRRIPKMNANVYVIEYYENETAFRPKKTNPNKANFRKAKMNLKSIARKSGHTLPSCA